MRCRALRVVNPSPYMIYLQARGSILVASSPEILCRLSDDGVVTNRCLSPASGICAALRCRPHATQPLILLPVNTDPRRDLAMTPAVAA